MSERGSNVRSSTSSAGGVPLLTSVAAVRNFTTCSPPEVQGPLGVAGGVGWLSVLIQPCHSQRIRTSYVELGCSRFRTVLGSALVAPVLIRSLRSLTAAAFCAACTAAAALTPHNLDSPTLPASSLPVPDHCWTVRLDQVMPGLVGA